MNIPGNREVFDMPSLIAWVDEDGVLCFRLKNTERKLHHYIPVIELIRKLTVREPICLLVDTTSSTSPMSGEIKDFLISELSGRIIAGAVISESLLGRAIGHLVMFVKPLPFPTRMFNDHLEAKAWLKMQHGKTT